MRGRRPLPGGVEVIRGNPGCRAAHEGQTRPAGALGEPSDWITMLHPVSKPIDRLLKSAEPTLHRPHCSSSTRPWWIRNTACSFLVDARGEARIRRGIALFRNRLLAEHLGSEPADVASELTAQAGSLVRTSIP